MNDDSAIYLFCNSDILQSGWMMRHNDGIYNIVVKHKMEATIYSNLMFIDKWKYISFMILNMPVPSTHLNVKVSSPACSTDIDFLLVRIVSKLVSNRQSTRQSVSQVPIIRLDNQWLCGSKLCRGFYTHTDSSGYQAPDSLTLGPVP